MLSFTHPNTLHVALINKFILSSLEINNKSSAQALVTNTRPQILKPNRF